MKENVCITCEYYETVRNERSYLIDAKDCKNDRF